MHDRLAALERRMEAFEERLRRVEERAAPSDAAPPEIPAAAISEAPSPGAPSSASAFLTAAGRTCVILGGAFLIRALTQSGSLSPRAGVAAAFAYGGFWLLLALRVRPGSASSTLSGVTGIVIAFPLVWEASTRWGVASPSGAIAGAALVSALAIAAAWRQSASWLAWAAAIGSVALFVALAPVTGRIDATAALSIALAAALSGLAYARRWPGPRWLAAAAADASVAAVAAVVTREGGPPDAYRRVSAASALALAAALPLASLTLFGLRALWRKRPLRAFEVVQSIAALVVGFGCATAVARQSGIPASAVGLPALATAIAFYAVAFGFVGREKAARGNFHFFASLGLLTALLGGVLWLGGAVLAGVWGALALACAWSGARFGRDTLRVHATVYLVAAFLASGLDRVVVDAFAAGAGSRWREFGTAAVLVAVASALVAAGAFIDARPSPGMPARISAVAFTAVAAAAAGAAALELAAGNGSALHRHAAAVAGIRSAILAGSAVLFALAARRRSDFAGLVYAILAAGGLKMLTEDLPGGTPVSLGVALALYGCALALCPRLLRLRAARGGSPPNRK
jgi:hypothetical protein